MTPDPTPTPPPSGARRALAGLASLVVPGLGHVVLGRFGAGLGWLVGFAAVSALAGVWLAGALVGALGVRLAGAIDCLRAARPAPMVQTRLMAAVLGFVALAVGLQGARTLVVGESFEVPAESMRPTLEPGDRVYVDRTPYTLGAATPRRGDVIAFTAPCAAGALYVKRVIGLPGDVVHTAGGYARVGGALLEGPSLGPAPAGEFDRSTCPPERRRAQVDGRAFDIVRCGDTPPPPASAQTPMTWSSYDAATQCHTFAQVAGGGPWTVPEGHVFVLGDHRHGSADSRLWGFVPVTDVAGTVTGVWWGRSADRILADVQPTDG